MDNRFPTRVHIGTQKAGSTYLYNMLADHPHLTLSRLEETHFFSDRFSKGADWYAGCFPEGDNKVDISPGAFKHSSTVPERMHDFYDRPEDLRFTLFLRNPIDYVSSHFHMHRMHKHFQKHPNEYPRPPKTIAECIERYPKYFSRGRYSRLLYSWMKYFERDQFKIVLFEDFIDEPQAVVSDMLRFWQIPNPDKKLSLPETSQNPALSHPALYKLRGGIARHTGLKRILKDSFLAKLFLRIFSTSPTEQITDEERRLLRDLFAEDVQKLEREFDVDTKRWEEFRP